MNNAFSKSSPNLQIFFDSTSLGYLKTCPRLYQYSMTIAEPGQGYQTKLENVHLIFGQLYHAALERYDHSRFAGRSHDEAQLDAVRFVLIATWRDGRPWNSDDKAKNRFTLLRTVVWYLEQFKEDSLRTLRLENGKPAVELSFRIQTEYHTSEGEQFVLCGHMDRLVEHAEDFYVSDRKTTKSTLDNRFFESFTPHNQFSGYTLAGKVVYKLPLKGLIVDAAQVAITFSRFERQIVSRHESQLEEWYKELGYWFGMAERYARENYWPMNDTACGNYGGCPFRPICNKTPGNREMWLRSGYVPRVWDPTQSRGDI